MTWRSEGVVLVDTADGFRRWWKAAKPGEACRYYRGFLALKREGNGTLRDLADVALRAADLGKVHLVQSRELISVTATQRTTFDYFAIKAGKAKR